MTDTIGAPSAGADVSGASSSATTTAPAGPPSRNAIVRSLKAKRAETPSKGPASPVEGTQTDGALGAGEPAKKPEGDTANLEAGKGENKPDGKAKEPESVPLGVFKERLAKEKGRREKLEADLHAARGNEAKVRHLLEVAITENERLLTERANGTAFDERGEELHGLRLQQAVKEQLAQKDVEHQQALAALQRDQGVRQLAGQLASEVANACAAFPLVSPAEVKAELRKNPHADIREIARVKHEERVAIARQQGAPATATSSLPTTVAKPTGVSKFQAPLSAKGMASAFRHTRAKG